MIVLIEYMKFELIGVLPELSDAAKLTIEKYGDNEKKKAKSIKKLRKVVDGTLADVISLNFS